MSYHDKVKGLTADAEQLEQVYRAARDAGDGDAFREAIDASHAQAPDNLLLAAWFYRLRDTAVKAKGYAVAWAWALPLAVANGLLLWLLSGDAFKVQIFSFQGASRTFGPAALLLVGPLSALFVLAYMALVGLT